SNRLRTCAAGINPAWFRCLPRAGSGVTTLCEYSADPSCSAGVSGNCPGAHCSGMVIVLASDGQTLLVFDGAIGAVRVSALYIPRPRRPGLGVSGSPASNCCTTRTFRDNYRTKLAVQSSRLVYPSKLVRERHRRRELGAPGHLRYPGGSFEAVS